MTSGVDATPNPVLVAAVAGFQAGVDGLAQAVDRSLSGADVALVLQVMQRVRNQLGGLDNHVLAALAELISQGVVPARNPVEYLVTSTHIDPRQARARVAAAVDSGPRHALTGAALPPLFALVASAQDGGDLSVEHAAVIRRAIDWLPPARQGEHGAQAEQILVAHAPQLTPSELIKAARRVIDHLDPDGRRPRDSEQHRRRGFGLRTNTDGTLSPYGRLTPELGAQLCAVLDPLAQPRTGEPTDSDGDGSAGPDGGGAGPDGGGAGPDGGGGLRRPGRIDERTLGQRQHDALADLVGLALRAGTLPSQGGLPASVYLTIPLDVLEHRVAEHLGTDIHTLTTNDNTDNSDTATATGTGGQSTTGHSDATAGGASPGSAGAGGGVVGGGYVQSTRGHELTVDQMLRIACDAQLIPVVLDRHGAPLDVGLEYRHATPTIRHALTVRDQGCTFPGCTIAPEWCEAHHVQPWWNRKPGTPRGPTKINNMALLCSFHHHTFETWGWTLHITNGIPTWTPPTTHDPDQKPITPPSHSTSARPHTQKEQSRLADAVGEGEALTASKIGPEITRSSNQSSLGE